VLTAPEIPTHQLTHSAEPFVKHCFEGIQFLLAQVVLRFFVVTVAGRMLIII
jgi:hypothetical protein